MHLMYAALSLPMQAGRFDSATLVVGELLVISATRLLNGPTKYVA